MTTIKTITLLCFVISMLTACTDKNNKYSDVKKLLIKQPCKPLANKCELLLPDNGENIQLQLSFKALPSYQRLVPISLKSSKNDLENILITMIIDGQEMPSEKMKQSEDKKHWEVQLLPFAAVTKDNLKLRLLVNYKSELYFSEFTVSY